ncbi:prepilin peptidase [Streptococcus zhangguiae]|nr:A24 family peptidase [Streptococcus sp. zg-70]
MLLMFVGASIGSFLSVVIDRFPEKSLLFPASHCNHCKQSLKWWDMIPVLSQLVLGFKCRYCKGKIPYWYLGLELIAAGLIVLLGQGLISCLQCILLFTGTILSIYDIKHQEYPLMVWGVFTFLALLFSSLNWVFCTFIILSLITEKYRLPIGSGDFFYLASLSLLFPLTELLWLIQLASLFGLLIFSIFKPKSLPFIPYLFLASLIVQVR